jgi:Phosphotransferase enzyme family
VFLTRPARKTRQTDSMSDTPSHPSDAEFDDGWDCYAELVDGRWVDRRPRRDNVAESLRRETVLLPWLGPQLPLPVPRPIVLQADPLVVRHELIDGDAWDGDGVALAGRLGRFLRALHRVSATDARRVGAPELAPDWAEDLRSMVLPLVDEDLAWVLHQTTPHAAEAAARGYGVKRRERSRALDWHALEPWYAVQRGRFLGNEPQWRAALVRVHERLRLLRD